MSQDVPSSVKDDAALCGICGHPFDDRHGADGHGGGTDAAGQRVEYVVVGRRGGIADFRETDGNSKVRRTDAATLALQLGVDEVTLPGCRFSCRVERTEYGVIRSGYTLVTE